MKLTLDSSEPLEDAMRVVGALYGVTLVVASGVQDATQSESNSAGTPATKRKAPNRNRTARRRPSPASKAEPVAAAADADSAPPEQTTAPQPVGSPSNTEVRAWARHNGFTVSDRGRVPASIVTAFRNAQAD